MLLMVLFVLILVCELFFICCCCVCFYIYSTHFPIIQFINFQFSNIILIYFSAFPSNSLSLNHELFYFFFYSYLVSVSTEQITKLLCFNFHSTIILFIMCFIFSLSWLELHELKERRKTLHTKHQTTTTTTKYNLILPIYVSN